MKKDTVRTAINVAAVILVPLISERNRIKDHEEVKKAKAFSLKAYDKTSQITKAAKDKTIHATEKAVHSANTVKNSTVNTAQFINDKVQTKKKQHDYNQQMNAHIKQERKEKKAVKDLEKSVTTLDNNLSKNIEKRRNEERKLLKSRQKSMISEMKEFKDYEAKAQKDIVFNPQQPKKLNRRDQKAIQKLQRNLDQTIAARHKIEDKRIEENQQRLIKEMKKYRNYKIKTPKQKSSFFGFNKKQSQLAQNNNINHSIVHSPSAPETQKANSTALKDEIHYNNAPTFEQHRKQMAEHIARRN